jgi:cytochrome c6
VEQLRRTTTVLKQFLKQVLTFALVCFTALIGFSGLSSPALAASSPDEGAQIFELHCAGCHIHGGNIVRRNKTLKLKALQRNSMDTLAAISEIVTNGRGNMSAYKDRLTDDEIQTVAAYVLEQAEQGWK